MTARNLGAGLGPFQYDFVVKCNGIALTSDDYTSFTINGVKVMSTSGSAPKAAVSGNPTSATIRLVDGKTVTAKVTIK